MGVEPEADSFQDTPRAAVIVAHPDDETLWAGGTILLRPNWNWTIVSLCRKSDHDRGPKFFRAAELLGARAFAGDFNDEPDQPPARPEDVEAAILGLLPERAFDLVITHSPFGEYTRHLRHEDTSYAVTELWRQGELQTPTLWMFAYEDAGRQHLPQPVDRAHRLVELSDPIWMAKYRIISQIYGFAPDSFEARTTPRTEAFWCFRSYHDFENWLNTKGVRNESTGAV
ncbi:MAG: PIG-L family deacetylase [Phycisphaerae bacterium]|nr:PIG-L family deacetylase [Phycisphaerae bacterium]